MQKSFGKILNNLMRERGVNQSDLARLLGCRQSQVSNWLSDKTAPGYHSLSLLCNKLKVPAGVLLGAE